MNGGIGAVLRKTLIGLSVFAPCSISAALLAEQTRSVDFARDVQPLLKQHCVSCHGPAQQMSGFRLDRRRDAMRGGQTAVIGPGNGAGSKLYLRLIGSDYGLQMPPTGPLKSEQIQIIKQWIDEGAVWPDELAGDVHSTVADPEATRIMDALRAGDRHTFQRLIGAMPGAVGQKGSGGATPLMYAALYGDASTVQALLERGADPNSRNDAGATALMWAALDLEKTRLLLDRGADPNARSDDGRTPLVIAASWRDSSPVLKMLLSRGATPTTRSAFATPLTEAAYIADAASLRTLIDNGVELKDVGDAVGYALWSRCADCVPMLAPKLQAAEASVALGVSASFGDGDAVRFLLDHGADPQARGPGDRTPLMFAAACDSLPAAIVKALVERGADVNAKSRDNETALRFARLRGETPVVHALLAAGAKDTPTAPPSITHDVAASPRHAIARSLPILQRADVSFLKKSGCVSCHNNSLTAMSVAAARRRGVPVDESTASAQRQAIAAYLEIWRDRLLQNVGAPGDADGVSYVLLGLGAERHPAEAATDAAARYLVSRQLADGSWRIVAHRPPLESSDIQVTAASMRALQLYAPAAGRAQYDKAIALAARWLAVARPQTTEERVFQLLGLAWSGAGRQTVQSAARSLLATQRPDGGWAQIPTLTSDAYATGQALAALTESRALPVRNAAFQRGVQFLLRTQSADGSWYVRSRATPFQPYFDAGFPHGHDQWISASATNWATMALAAAIP